MDGLSNQVTPQERYLSQVNALLESLATTLSADERAEIQHLIDHGEPAEGLRALAWIIVDAGKFVPSEAIAAIRTLSEGLVPEADMPPALDAHSLPTE